MRAIDPTRWLRAPLAHFVAGGAALFCLAHATAPREERAIAPVVLSAADVTRLRSDYTRDTGLEPGAADEAALVEKAIEEELLFREAVARGLDRNDRSVRNWLVEQMKVVSEGQGDDPDRLYARARELGLDRTDLVVRRILVQKMRLVAARSDDAVPSEDELVAFYAEHRDDYRMPERVSFWQVFLSSDVHGPAVQADARTLLETLRRAGAPADGTTGGESFVVPAHVVGQQPAQLAKVFGREFAAEIARTEPQAWAGPFASPYGLHLVWIEGREAGDVPSLDAVRGQVLARWQDEHRTERVVALLEDLKRRYPLEIESSAWQDRRRS
jgi:hypothetical protein